MLYILPGLQLGEAPGPKDADGHIAGATVRLSLYKNLQNRKSYRKLSEKFIPYKIRTNSGLYREGNILEAAVELVIAFKLEPIRIKQYETEFPALGKESDYIQLDLMIHERIVSEPKADDTETDNPEEPTQAAD